MTGPASDVLDTLLFVGALALYLLPTILAAVWNRRMTGWIFLLNFFVGWTVIGWIGALVWAVVDTASQAAPVLPAQDVESLQTPAPTPLRDASPPAPGERMRLRANHILRVGPAMISRSTGELRVGADVTIVQVAGAWVWVQADDGRVGWIELKR